MDLLASGTIDGLARDAAHCTRCPLHANATQTVFGEGAAHAPLMIVGEQPGDQEDKAGKPFVGPAGKMLDRALADAAIDRGKVYVTNAVKHFKWEPRGKFRLHKKPSAKEIDICRWWLDQEFDLVEPELIVAMGATAARGIGLGSVTITAMRGRILDLPAGRKGLVTVHPSFLLRLPDEEARAREYGAFVADLALAARAVPTVATGS